MPNCRTRSFRKKEQAYDKKKAAGSLAGAEGQGSDTALKCKNTLAELAQQFDFHPNQIANKQSQEQSAVVYGESAANDSSLDIQTMQALIGQLKLENYFLGALTKAGLLSAVK